MYYLINMDKNFDKKVEKSTEISNQETIENLDEDELFQVLKTSLKGIKQKYNLNSGEILSLAEKNPISKEILIPVSIFEHKLSSLEVICKYLKEELNLSNSKIASFLNRDVRNIWTAYNNALKKRKERLVVKESKFFIPVSVLSDRHFSVLESICKYLKDKFGLRYREIAVLLNRNERNIWAVYNRSKKK